MYLFRNIPIVFLLSFLPHPNSFCLERSFSRSRVEDTNFFAKITSNYYSSRFHQNRFIDPSKGTTTGKYKIIIQSTCSVETFSRIYIYVTRTNILLPKVSHKSKKKKKRREGKRRKKKIHATITGRWLVQSQDSLVEPPSKEAGRRKGKKKKKKKKKRWNPVIGLNDPRRRPRRRVGAQSAKLTGAFIISVDKAYTHLVNGTMSPFLARLRNSGGEER